MKRLCVMRAISGIALLSTILLSGCIASGASFYLYGKDGAPISEVHAKFKPLASFHSGSAAHITNDSRYDLQVITLYVSERGYWHAEKIFEVPASSIGFAGIPAPGYTNWGTCGQATITIRVVIYGNVYSSVMGPFSVCNWQPTIPAFLITNGTVERRIMGQGELWDRPRSVY